MDSHLHEALGTISRWALLALAACAAVGIAAWVLLALPATHTASQAWSVLPDAVASVGQRLMPVVHCEPALTIQRTGLFFAYREDQPDALRTSWVDLRNSQIFLHAGPHQRPGSTELLAVANPYSGMSTRSAGATLKTFARPSSLLVVDIDSLSGLVKQGQLIASAEQAAPGLLGRLGLARLMSGRPAVYVTRVHLDQYARLRSLAASTAEAPLLPASTRRHQQGTTEQAAAVIRRLSHLTGAPTTLVTADIELARRSAHDSPRVGAVYLVGQPMQGTPAGVIVASTLRDLPF